MAAAFSVGSFIMILLLIRSGIYFFFRDGQRYWWQMGTPERVADTVQEVCVPESGIYFICDHFRD